MQDLLPRLKGVKQAGNGWLARCPAHDDDRASLSIASGDRQEVVFKCHAGCTNASVLAALGIERPKRDTRQLGREVARYDYIDEHGTLLSYVQRYEPKDFRPFRPDGRGGWTMGMKGVRRVLYNLPTVRAAAAAGKTIYYTEGEKDVESLRALGIVATTVAGGVGAPIPDDFAGQFKGAKGVVILPDNDDPGREYAHKVARLLSAAAIPCKIVELPGLGPKQDVTDWVCDGGTAEQLNDLVKTAERYVLSAASTPIASSPAARVTEASQPEAPDKGLAHMSVVALHDVQSRAVRWLWRLYLAFGKLVVIDGFPGQGKSTVCIDVAARLSRGRAMPDGSPGVPACDTLILTYEDDAADTLKPRLEAAGGDARRVHHITGVSYNGNHEVLLPPSLPKDLALLDQTLGDRPEIRFVVIDPLAAALGADVDSHRDQDVRRVLSQLSRIAEQRGVCIAIVRHVRKSHGGNAITAGGGSIGIIGQARIGLLVDRHPEEPNGAVLAVAKSNLAQLGPSLTFRKVSATVTTADGETVETSRIEWTGTAAMTADELLAARDEAGGDDEQDVTGWLRDVLAGTQMERKAIMKAANAAGFSDRTVDRAAKRLGVVKERVGFGPDCRSMWRLTSTADRPTSAIGKQFSQVPPQAEVAEVGKNGGSGGVLPLPTAPQFGCPTCARRFHHYPGDEAAPGDDRCFLCRRAGVPKPSPEVPSAA